MLDKTYNPGEAEARLYRAWEEAGVFARGRKPGAEPFTIVMPPPNVTGNLHMGHALDNTLQDVLVRYYRLKGRDVLWQPGTDHAGIATQMVVERNLASQGLNRRAMGRDAFVNNVWEWKAQSGGAITRQLRRLGASCDWSRERFTMDEGLSRAVLKVFVQLYREGLIYRDKRLVNWDPKLLTAISDLEVESREVKGHLWKFRYPIEGEEGRHITVATTRPETMLGDTGVAVHPEDERYRDLIGRHVILPIVGRRIPIVADDHADPEQGTGAVKITPAHDFNDFEVGKRHNLPQINIFDEHAHLNDEVPERYRGLDRFDARKAIVAEMESLGLLEGIDDHVHMQPFGDRSGVVIEPWLTDQWYVDAATLAKPAIEAVKDGRTRFVPATWEKTYFNWMENIQPWCISRQLWWGHQIPAWYDPQGNVYVAECQEDAQAQAGEGVELRRDEDVLDTWFSSGLWPFSTLGWPETTEVLERHYPNDVLVTGFDIIFFWVARMMMMGLKFMGDVPFRTVYIHALVRDEHGQKMSKSKGNVIDPLQFIDTYGADALRFTMAAMEAQGRDIKLSEKRVEGYRNFGTKLWNAARLTQMYDCAYDTSFDPAGVTSTLNRWIVGEIVKTEERITRAIEAFRYNDAADAIYHFTWGTYCDWYLEFIKPVLTDGAAAEQAETRATAAWALDQILIMLHPFMPFITEELWGKLRQREAMLVVADWPDYSGLPRDDAAFAEIDWLVRLITGIRAVRAEMNVPVAAKIKLKITDYSDSDLARLRNSFDILKRMVRIEKAYFNNFPGKAALKVEEDSGISYDYFEAQEVRKGAIQLIQGEMVILIPLEGVIDIAAEKERLQKEIGKTDKEITTLDKRLSNQGFVAKAPEAVVAEARARLEEYRQTRQKLEDALVRLG